MTQLNYDAELQHVVNKAVEVYLTQRTRPTPFVGQNYDDVKELFPKYSRIIITGPNRTGTTFFSRALAEDLNYTCIDEGDYDYDLEKFKRLIDPGKVVVQGPGMIYYAHKMHELHKDLLVVVMVRDIKAILMSSYKIRGTLNPHPGGLGLMLGRYFTLPEMTDIVLPLTPEAEGNIPLDCSQHIRYTVWDTYQRELTPDYVELNYQSLQTHPKWLAKEQRAKFHGKQTQ